MPLSYQETCPQRVRIQLSQGSGVHVPACLIALRVALFHGLCACSVDMADVYKYCSPTRSALMSGRVPLHVNQNNACNDALSASGIDLRMTIMFVTVPPPHLSPTHNPTNPPH